ncbi:MAG: hypothetical protein AB1815_05865 [Bacillota bacterium]
MKIIFVLILLIVGSPMLLMAVFLPFLLAPAGPDTPGAGGQGSPPGEEYLLVPDEIRYRDRTAFHPALIEWLTERNSALATPAHLNAIEEAGRKYDVDPILLLAITGQEQAFVPRRGNWRAIERNPWNVFHSWQRWSGGFELSAQWAAHTVMRLSQDCPPGVGILRWINGLDNTGQRANPRWGYAGHTGWHIGVGIFYQQLKAVGGV